MTQAKLDAALEAAVAEKRIVGGVLLVSEGGRTVYSRAIGLSDRDAGRAMQETDRFRLASVTKPIATACFMSLVEDGTLALDAPVTAYLPDFRPRLPDGSRPEITLHHLVTHTSGLGYRFLEPETGPYPQAGISDGMDQPGLSIAENLARIAVAPLYFAPGTGWRYSVGLDVMGAVAEAATGQGMQALIDARISAPLGLGTLRFHVPPAEDLVTPYINGEPMPRLLEDGDRPLLWGEGGVTFAPSRVHDSGSFPSCGAGLTGSAGEVMAVMRSLMGHGTPILRPETVAGMMRPQIPPEVMTMRGPGFSFGYGWAIVTDPGLAGLPDPKGMLKWGGVYGHSWFIDPAADRISLLLTNTAYEGMQGLLPAEILAAFYT